MNNFSHVHKHYILLPQRWLWECACKHCCTSAEFLSSDCLRNGLLVWEGVHTQRPGSQEHTGLSWGNVEGLSWCLLLAIKLLGYMSPPQITDFGMSRALQDTDYYICLSCRENPCEVDSWRVQNTGSSPGGWRGTLHWHSKLLHIKVNFRHVIFVSPQNKLILSHLELLLLTVTPWTNTHCIIHTCHDAKLFVINEI